MPAMPGSALDTKSMTVGISDLQVLRRPVHPGNLPGYDK
ncbi:hypothetical protein D1BOALGB6SA_8109 [Olavius sp. associated proteobacterium Delta 1]|nr:hypothetical protein D1BOALGB6SA_8109 [Olavius sp. associated proteobacterium Delta 1]